MQDAKNSKFQNSIWRKVLQQFELLFQEPPNIVLGNSLARVFEFCKKMQLLALSTCQNVSNNDTVMMWIRMTNIECSLTGGACKTAANNTAVEFNQKLRPGTAHYLPVCWWFKYSKDEEMKCYDKSHLGRLSNVRLDYFKPVTEDNPRQPICCLAQRSSALNGQLCGAFIIWGKKMKTRYMFSYELAPQHVEMR